MDVGSVTFGGTTSGTRITIASTYLGAPGEASPHTRSRSRPRRPSHQPGSPPSPPPVGPARDITLSTRLVQPDAGVPDRSLAGGRDRLCERPRARVANDRADRRPGQTQHAEPADRDHRRALLAARCSPMACACPAWPATRQRGARRFTATAQNEFCVRAGNAGALRLTLNGVQLDALGANGEVGSWIINGVDPPTPAPGALLVDGFARRTTRRLTSLSRLTDLCAACQSATGRARSDSRDCRIVHGRARSAT